MNIGQYKTTEFKTNENDMNKNFQKLVWGNTDCVKKKAIFKQPSQITGENLLKFLQEIYYF